MLRAMPILVLGLRTPGVQQLFRGRAAQLCGRAASRAPPPSCAAVLDETTLTTTRDVPGWLEERVQAALVEAYGPEYAETNPLITPATKPEFGDYQCNVAMGLAKRLGQKPRDVASTIVGALKVDECFEAPEIAGPGFLNLRFTKPFLVEQLGAMLADGERCGVPPAPRPQRVVVDYSSPNIAKEMHVGHLRSTIIGDTLARVLELRGHEVQRFNHVGDWGTQFGMLITLLRQEAPAALSGEEELDISDLVAFYKRAKAQFDADDAFKETSRRAVVQLQAGDGASLAAWRLLCEQSAREFNKVYSLLSVDPRLEVRGESFYNGRLADVVERLREGGVLAESEGARCVFLDGYKNRDGTPLPFIVQKGDGGFLYATTDLAALSQRADEERAERVLYVTDSGQSSHFQQVFAVGRQARLVPEQLSLEHVPFGLVLGEDGKKFKTRSGETVRLMDLLQEALARARADVEARLATEGRDESDEFVATVARAVGIGAVKYADLSMNRNSNYKFSYAKMLALQGNTAPYMLYAYARVRGIERKAAAAVAGGAGAGAGADGSSAAASEAGVAGVAGAGAGGGVGVGLDVPLELRAEAELALARHLLKLGDVVREVERDLLPSRLCEYIFELAGKFNVFYENCPVLGAETAELQASRLALCGLAASVLKLNLDLLGIETLERL